MKRIELEVIKIGHSFPFPQYSKSEIIKPKEACGTCGYFPKAWTMAYVFKSERNDPIKSFLRSNKNWVREEVFIK
jgi:hypothetical protein